MIRGKRGEEADMEHLLGRTALVTGASGGIGRQICRRLAEAGVNVIASGRREAVLAEVVDELRGIGVRSEAVIADLAQLDQVDSLVERADGALREIDLLINNAGIEITAAFTNFSREELTSMVNLNLVAPMLLTHLVVPGMLERGRGHVVFVSSLAGKVGPPFNEPYSASKAGLVGFNHSLRSEYRHAPIGFSVICPGFTTGDGMYQRMKEEGIRSNRLMGETTTEKVADQVVDAIRRDRPEVLEAGAPIRPLLALSQLAPRFNGWSVERFGATALFRRTAELRDRA